MISNREEASTSAAKNERPHHRKHHLLPTSNFRSFNFNFIDIPYYRIMIARHASHAMLQRLSLTSKTSSFVATRRAFETWQQAYAKQKKINEPPQPGGKAFAECEMDAVRDLFHGFAKTDQESDIKYLDMEGVRELLKSVGERPDEATLQRLYDLADENGDGVIELYVRIIIFSGIVVLCFVLFAQINLHVSLTGISSLRRCHSRRRTCSNRLGSRRTGFGKGITL